MATIDTIPTAAGGASSTGAVALAGNPNTGKSTLFNRLTGIRQRTGNYPGVTVEKHVGKMNVDAQELTLVDLPGTYSLAAASADERVVVDVLSGHLMGVEAESKVALAVCVVDATNLMRHLFLASQISDTGVPIIIALNMIDAAHEQGLAIDAKLLNERLGVPVVPTSASKGQGIEELKRAIAEGLRTQPRMKPITWPEPVNEAMAYLRQSLPPEVGEGLTDAEVQRMLFDTDSAVADRIKWSPAQRVHHIDHARKMLRDNQLDACGVEPTVRYGQLAQWMDGVQTRPAVRKATGTESIDSILTHRVAGLIVFVAMMFVVFWSIYTAAGPFMDAIDVAFGTLGEWAGGLLAATPMLQSLVVDGIIAGVGGVVIFLPQILILFFFISLLEDTGYMARAAYLMDKLFAWSGLNGRSFVPLLSSYACAIPGIMAARTIENPKARLTTILIAPLMSCSARLPVYVLLIGAFIEPVHGATVAAAALFGMHALGFVLAGPIAFALNKLWFGTHRTPFIMEMPPYRVPALRDVALRMWDRGLTFLKTAGTVIFAMSVVIWALSYFPRPADLEQRVVAEMQGQPDVTEADIEHGVDATYLEQSYLGRFGKAIQPVFAPAGFDWKITVGVVSSFPAREVIISTLGITYALGGDVNEEDAGLIETMRASTWPDGSPVFTVPVAMAIMVFFALCLQCGATVAIIARESSWKWAVFAFVYMTVLAWVGAVVTYQVGTAIGAAA